jgi:hypothetical protein
MGNRLYGYLGGQHQLEGVFILSDRSMLISSKDILLKTGISRATLNNYIKMGILSKPIVQTPLDGLKGPRKLGYFPSSAIEVIEKLKRLKSQGLSMMAIADELRTADPIQAAESARQRIQKIRKAVASQSLALFPEMDSPSTVSRDGKVGAPSFKPPRYDVPALLNHCVLHVSLENWRRLSDESPPEDFFSFIEKIWDEFEAICSRHDGFCQHGALFSAFFIGSGSSSWVKKVLNASIEVRSLSGRKKAVWTTGRLSSMDVSLKAGLGFAEEYGLMLKGSPGRMIMAAGYAALEARLLSQHAQGGTLWASKNLLCRLTAEERRAYRFGIREGEAFLAQKFIRIDGDSFLSPVEQKWPWTGILAAELR